MRLAPQLPWLAIAEALEREAVLIERLTERLFLVDGACLVRDLNRYEGFAIPESDVYATVRGFLVTRLERRPCVGDVVEHAGWRYMIVQVAGWCVGRVWVGRMCQQDGNGAMPVNAS